MQNHKPLFAGPNSMGIVPAILQSSQVSISNWKHIIRNSQDKLAMLNKRSQYLATGTAATCDVMRCCLTVSSHQRSVGRACIRPRCLIALSKLFLVRTLLRLGKPAFFMSTPLSWRASLMAVVTDVWLLAFLHASISSAVRSESLRSAHGVS